MKITCEYCDSYVEIDEHMKCPMCCAPLGNSVEIAKAKAAKEEQAEREREAQIQEQEARDTHISEIIQGVSSVAAAFISGVTAAKGPAVHTQKQAQPYVRTGMSHHERPTRLVGFASSTKRMGGTGVPGSKMPGGKHNGPGFPGGPGGRH